MKSNTSILISLTIFFFSCITDDTITYSITDDTTEMSSIDHVNDPNFTGTACGVRAITDLALNEEIQYEYITNISVPMKTWTVKSGDIQIISGSNSSIVTIILGENFTVGVLHVKGYSELNTEHDSTSMLICGFPITITKN